MINSLSGKLESMLETDAFSWKDAISSEWKGKPIVHIIHSIIIGKQYQNAIDNDVSEKFVINLAQEYLSHPADVDWMNVTTMKWASTHIGSVQNAQNKGFLDKLQKEHHHHIEQANHSQHEFLENISHGLSELKKFYEKAKEMEKDLEISDSSNESIEYIKQKITF